MSYILAIATPPSFTYICSANSYSFQMAKDIYHNLVREALEKEGWTITHYPLIIKPGGIRMEVDLAAEQVLYHG